MLVSLSALANGRWEVWQLINLTGDTHPIHIHLEPFHILARRPITVTVPGNGIGDRDTTATVRLARDPGDELAHVIDANERGLKDTVRVNPREIVEFAMLNRPKDPVEISLRRTSELTARLSLNSPVLNPDEAEQQEKVQFERNVAGLAKQLRSPLDRKLGRYSVDLPVFPVA